MAKKRARTGKKNKTRTGKQSKKSMRSAAITVSGAPTKERTSAQQVIEEIWENNSKGALWSEHWVDANDTSPTAVLLRHPTAPFVAQLDRASAIRQVGYDYLIAAKENPNIDPAIELPQSWLDALNPQKLGEADITFAWLPIGWPPTSSAKVVDDTPPAFASFRVDRTSQEDGRPLDDTIVLLATECYKDTTSPVGSGFGIRILAHTRPDKPSELRITGMSASLPFGPYRATGLSTDDKGEDKRSLILDAISIVRDKDKEPAFRAQIASTLGIDPSFQIRGIRAARTGEDVTLEFRCMGKVDAGQTNPVPYMFVFSTTFTPENGPGTPVLLSKDPLAAEVDGHAFVFTIDPASQGGAKDIRSRRPTRSEHQLEHYWTEEQITDGARDPLVFPLRNAANRDDLDETRIVLCPGFVQRDPRPTPQAPDEIKYVELAGTVPLVRSNDFAAINALWHVEHFFERLGAYGLNNSTDSQGYPLYPYFRMAKLPLRVHYRSGIRPGAGKDGKTVNACVLVDGWRPGFEGPTKPGERPGLQMHLALADLSTRARKPWDGKDKPAAEPLGIAADARWIWHEIGHVLLMAGVGELQFRFAHSAGDALAAIVADPQSQLAKDLNWRGATFPWAFIPRRHDRCVLNGWSWGGLLHYALSQVPRSQRPRRKAYWTEQILSSSLFRLYRCIGGDTILSGQPDDSARQSASHYSVYLIMRGIEILGTSDAVPAYEPDQFVSALIDADIATGTWDVTFPPAPEPSSSYHRVGGCVHKVIRWAFEAQGLYGGSMQKALGVPPPVDIFIKDLRPTADETPHGKIEYRAGSYIPVSLHWQQTASAPAPAWQADPAAIFIDGNGDISIVVGNRGSQAATGVEVSVWWLTWPGTTPTGMSRFGKTATPSASRSNRLSVRTRKRVFSFRRPRCHPAPAISCLRRRIVRMTRPTFIPRPTCRVVNKRHSSISWRTTIISVCGCSEVPEARN